MRRRPALAVVRAVQGVALALAVGLAAAPAPAAPDAAGAAAPAAWVPRFGDVRAAHRPSDIPLLARDGTPLQWVRVDPLVRRGPWLPLREVSPALRLALVLSEDRRFWEHSGVDWPALAAGAWAAAWDGRTRGASTLSMQLAALLDDDLRRPAGGRHPGQKLQQIALATALETRWRKTEILEAYLNLVPLRGENVGVVAGSWSLFGKHPRALDATESALLAALVRSPNAGPGPLRRRACELLQAQQRSCAALDITLSQALVRAPGPLHQDAQQALAPHLAALLAAPLAARRPAPGGATPAAAPLAWRSTLQASVQQVATQALRQQLAELRGRAVQDGAVVVLHNRTGEVWAWVGSAGPGASAREVDAVLARRQPGSAVKPFVYALALQQRLLTAASRLDDRPLQRVTGGALYQPQNYDHRHQGWVTVRQALAGSLNVPAVQVGLMVGADALFETFQAAGLQLQHSAAWHGMALPLGTADVSLLALTNAYRLLANGGRWTAPRWLVGPAAPAEPARQVFSPAVAWLVADILADPAARAGTFGLDSALSTRGWAAVKTGTSKDMRDNWCIGFDAGFTVGVWVGNADGAPMRDVSGVSGAAPVWQAVMEHLRTGVAGWQDAPARPVAPPGLVSVAGEWYLAGTQPPPAASAGLRDRPVTEAFGITEPQPGTVWLLDPEIPRRAQQLRFAGAPGRWWLNDRALGQGRVLQEVRWSPQPGRWRLRWESAGETRVEGARQELAFEVRAAPPAAPARPRPPALRPPG